MGRSRVIALVAGAVVTVAVFIVIMALLISAPYEEEKDRIIMVSIALGPVLMVSVMVGYSVWWGVLFLLTLLFPEDKRKQPEQSPRI
jgi:hypothetical protein